MTNIVKLFQKELEKVKKFPQKPKLLLHTCCAMCFSSSFLQIKDYFQITVYYFNPNIFPLKEYEKTQLIKKDKEFKKKELSEEIQFLKKIVKCQDCGNLCYRNVNKKWLCKNKCNDKNSITDSVLITSILKGSKQIIENSKNLNSRQLQKHFYEGIETLQYLKEIYRRIDEQEMNNRLIKKLIVQYASSRFDKCVENLDIYSNFVLENSKQLISNQQQLVQYLKNNIINIEISKKNIEIHYINGVSLLIKEDENE